MATDDHKPSALDDFKLDFEDTGTEGKISAFALRKIAKYTKKAERGPSIIKQIIEVYGEVLFA